MPPNDEVSNAQLLAGLARLEGGIVAKIEGMATLMQANHETLKHRLETLRDEVLGHIDRHESQITQVANIAREAKDIAIEARTKADAATQRSAKFGVAGAGLISAGIEIAKAFFHH